MLYFAALALGVAFVGIPAAVCGYAQSRAIVEAIQGIARQPEATGKIQLVMLIGLAFIESLTIYSLVISFILIGKLPSADMVLGAITKVVQ